MSSFMGDSEAETETPTWQLLPFLIVGDNVANWLIDVQVALLNGIRVQDKLRWSGQSVTTNDEEAKIIILTKTSKQQ